MDRNTSNMVHQTVYSENKIKKRRFSRLSQYFEIRLYLFWWFTADGWWNAQKIR